MSRTSGFTIIELLVVIAVLGIIATISVVSYGRWRHNAAKVSVVNDLTHATTSLDSYKNFRNDYPPNLGGAEFAASDHVALTLRTNAPEIRSYSSLTSDQNAQLFLNSCNAAMPTESGGVTYNTACTFAGNNVHVSGTKSSNVILHGPVLHESDIVLTCGSACDTAVTQMLKAFRDQGGTFPITVPKKHVSLPPYPDTVTYGPATKFCLQGVSASFEDIVYHTTSSNAQVTEGPCPDDPELHYP